MGQSQKFKPHKFFAYKGFWRFLLGIRTLSVRTIILPIWGVIWVILLGFRRRSMKEWSGGLRVFEVSQNGPQISNICNNKRVRYCPIRTLRTLRRTLHSLIVCLSLNWDNKRLLHVCDQGWSANEKYSLYDVICPNNDFTDASVVIFAFSDDGSYSRSTEIIE